MTKKYRFFLLIVSFLFFTIKAQENTDDEKKTQFEKLEKLITNEKRKEIALELSKRYIALAKLYKESDLLYNGYVFAAQNSKDSTAIKYCDSLILHTTKTKNSRYIGLAYSGAATICMKSFDFKKSTEFSIIAHEYLKNDISKEFIYEGIINIGKLKYFTEDYAGANKIWKMIFEYYSWKIKQKSNADNFLLYQYSLSEFIKTNAKLQRFSDNKRLISQAYKLKNDDNELLNLLIADGVNNLEQRKYQQALVKFIKASAIKNQHQTDRKALIDFYLAVCYYKLNNEKQALPLFLKIVNDYKKLKKTNLNFRLAFDFLTEYYKKNGTTEQQLASMNDLLEFDKYEKDARNYIQASLREFDKKYPSEEENNSQKSQLISDIIGYIIIFLSSLAVIYYIIKKVKFNTKTEKKLSENENFVDDKITEENLQPQTIESFIENEIDYSLYRPINRITVDQILTAMNTFESSLGFLEQDLKLTSLAQKFSTNDKYLSKVIKIKTGKTFNVYLADLRFNYLDYMMQKDSQFRNQKIKEISAKLGFGSPEFFATAFKEKYGKSPKEFFGLN